MKLIQGHHHVTLCVWDAQEDYDFHTQVLGMKSVKKTVLFDGPIPIYHLYYGNHDGDAGTLITTFPMSHTGVEGRPGTGQIKIIQVAAPATSMDFWEKRLRDHGFAVKRKKLFGKERVEFDHPCKGIVYQIVGVTDDKRPAITADGIAADVALRGVYGISLSVREKVEEERFLGDAWGFEKVAEEGNFSWWRSSHAGPANTVEVEVEPNRPQGSWTFSGRTVHHCAFKVEGPEQQQIAKDHIVGLGYTDTSGRFDRKYFLSVYVRTPGGPLFEAAYSHPLSFTIDEQPEHLGEDFQLPEWFQNRSEEIWSKLEPIQF